MHRPTPRIEIVKREHKEDKLARFVRDCSIPASGAVITVLARSLTSPVIRALSTVLAEAGNTSVTLRIILTHTDGLHADDATLFAGHTVTFRWARQPRLADAHEQLVIANATWIGDCMRRDPAKRDAFECYSPDCSRSVRWATMAFERLWSHAEPTSAAAAHIAVIAPAETAPVAPLATTLPAADNGEPAPLASTRH